MHRGKMPGRRAGAGAIGMIALACVAVPAGASVVGGPPELPRPVASGVAFVPGEAIVRFEPGAGAPARRAARRGAAVSFEESAGVPRAEVVGTDGPVAAAVRRLESQPGVAYAQPNYRYEALAASEDTFSAELWGLDDPAMPNPGVGAEAAWQTTRGAGQAIAVLDTGVDLTHPDLAPNLWVNPSPDPGDEDLHGYDFVDGDGDPDDYNFHGTHVAGTAAAVADNSLGIAGVAPAAEIMAVRVLDGDGSGSTADIAAGIGYAAENGADVINMSLGGPSGVGDQAMSDAIAEAAAAGVVTVVAAGNEGADNDAEPHTPCALSNPSLICVAALSRGSGALAGFSNYGATTVDLAAPGTQILSAKTDYGSPLLEEGFEAGLGQWESQAFAGGLPWGESGAAASGAKSATDSPVGDYGQSAEEGEFAESLLYTENPVDLSGERGCRMHFKSQYEIETIFDGFFIGGFSEAPFEAEESVVGYFLDGTSPGYPGTFTREEVSISPLDGRTDAHPLFGIVSDYEVEFDGAYVDDVRLICRDDTYEDAIATVADYDLAGSGNYVRFQGTSMATPHVAGVVALVRAAAPGLSVAETVDAVVSGISAMPSPEEERPTATFGIADACQAIALATEDPEPACPGSSPPLLEPEEEPEPEPAPDGGSGGSPAGVDRDGSTGSESQAGGDAARLTRHATFFRKRPRRFVLTRGRAARVRFVFGSTARSARFFCRVDRQRRWRRCPRRLVRRFRVGRHVLRVRSRDAAGRLDRRAAVFVFRVRPRR